MKPYIEQANDLYSNVLKYDIHLYASIIYKCLHNSFDIKTSHQITVLAEVAKNQYSYGVCWNGNDITSIKSFDEKEFNSNNTSYQHHYILSDVDSQFDDHFKDGPLAQVYRNAYRVVILTSIISPYHVADKDLEEKEWIQAMQNSLKSDNLVKFCVAYMYEYHKSKLTEFAESISLEFYILFSQSALKAEYLSINNYGNILSYKKSDHEQIYNIYPDFIKEIKTVIASINTIYTRINAYLDSNEINNEIIPVSPEEPFSFKPSSASQNFPNFIDTEQSCAISDVICHIYNMSFIDIVYISTLENLQKLITLLNGIKQLNEYCCTSSQNGVISQTLRDRVLSINNIIEIKCAILIEQIKNHKTPEKDAHCIQYDLSDGYAKRRLKELQINIIAPKNIFINFCKNKNKDRIHSLNEFEEKYHIGHFKHVKNSMLDKYNNYVRNGIQHNIENSPIYEAIKNDEMDKSIKLLEKLMEKPDTYKIKSITPSLYFIATKYLYKKTKQMIEARKNFNELINLLFKVLDALRLFTITYKPKHNTPYRFRPIFEYSFYKYDQVQGQVTQYIPTNIAQGHESVAEQLAGNESLFFVASWDYPRPINFDYIETFFMRYNRKAHFLDLKIREISEELQYNKNAEFINEKLRDEQKRTVQLLTIFGTFIAFVSSIAGMLKSVSSIWSFLLFCMVFIGCLTVFVGLVHLIIIPKKAYVFRIMIYFLLVCALLFGIWETAQFVYDKQLCDLQLSEQQIPDKVTVAKSTIDNCITVY